MKTKVRTKHKSGSSSASAADETTDKIAKSSKPRTYVKRNLNTSIPAVTSPVKPSRPEADPAWAELLLQDAVLLAEVVEDLLLFAVQQTGEGGDEEDVRRDGVRHGPEG